MDSAPLPPHERTWRHPSELAASTAVVEPGRTPRGLVLAGGTLAVVMVATMVIALTPRQDTATTTAITATTIPAPALRSSVDTAAAAAESIRNSRLSGFTAIPSAIADIPAAVVRSADDDIDRAVTDRVVLPDLDDRVAVLTEQFVYSVAWRDVGRIDVTNDAVVVDESGIVVARIVDGHLVVSPDLVVGASLSVD